jgi:hypothetical protein
MAPRVSKQVFSGCRTTRPELANLTCVEAERVTRVLATGVCAKLTEKDDSFGAAALFDRTIPWGAIQTPGSGVERGDSG